MARRSQQTTFLIVLAAALAASGCGWMYSTSVPIETTAYPFAKGQIARTLVVLLPGRGDDGEAFAEHGFVKDLRAAGVAADVVAVDAHFGYYAKETIVERVWNDVVAPARARGYKEIWLAGISMGGLGVVAVARQHASAFDRLILLAPYLGPDELLDKIRLAGGPTHWKADDPKDPYQRLWTWLSRYQTPGPPQITLAYGTNDRLASAHRLLAPLLGPGDLLEEPGGHDWTTWHKLWLRLFPPAK
jgi:pimeloyl-ACP methyl ester carboxylesterase